MPAITINTNSWVTLIEANDYLDEKSGATAWASLSDDDKSRYLISAYRWINRMPDYEISVVTDNLKYAQIELAWYIYINGETHQKHEALQAQGVDTFRISKFSEDLSGKTDLPSIVKDLLDEYNTNAGGYFPLVERDVDQNQ